MKSNKVLSAFYDEADSQHNAAASALLEAGRSYAEHFQALLELARVVGMPAPVPVVPLEVLNAFVADPAGSATETPGGNGKGRAASNGSPAPVDAVLEDYADEVDGFDRAVHVAVFRLRRDASQSSIYADTQEQGHTGSKDRVKHRLNKWLDRTIVREEHPTNPHKNYYRLKNVPPFTPLFEGEEDMFSETPGH